jgi:ABC-type nitrate/sulfonate/bicarbonate transport system permease component
MADVALERKGTLVRREPFLIRWYRENTSAARAVTSFIAVGILWELAGRSGKWPLIVTPLSSIFQSFWTLAVSGQLWRHVSTSSLEFLYGFALAAVVGILIGIAIATSEVARDFIDPWISALYSTPTVALAPLFIVIFGIDLPSKIAVVFLLAVFPVVINTAAGIRATEQVYLEAARSFCASRRQIFQKVLLPSALPFIVAGLRLGIGRGLVGVVVGELFGARAGLGYLVLTSSQLFDTSGVWVGVFILAGTGILSVVILQKVERRMAPWRQFEFK